MNRIGFHPHCAIFGHPQRVRPSLAPVVRRSGDIRQSKEIRSSKTRPSRFSSVPQIRRLLLGYAKISNKTRRVCSGVQGEGSM